MRRVWIIVVACGLAGLPPSVPADEAPDVPMRPYLSFDAAWSGVDGCLAFARARDLRVAVAVRDRGGRLVAFARMDDVFAKQAEFARLKAETSSTTPASTRRIGEITAPGSPLEGLVQLPGVTRVEGGEPVVLASGYHVGGVGVSGASPAQDGECARLAAAQIVKALEASGG